MTPPRQSSARHEVGHMFCDACGDDLALCGLDVTDHPIGDSNIPCLPCEALLWKPCPRCGDTDEEDA